MTPSLHVRIPVAAALLCLAAACGTSSTPTAGGSSTPSAVPAGTVAALPTSPSPTAASPTTVSPSSAGPGPTPTGPVEVPSRVLQTLPAVPLTSPATFGTGVRAQVTAVKAVTSAGSGAGQVAGAPAVAFSISLINGSPAPVPLSATNVALTYGADADPGLPVDGSPATSFGGVLAPGATASAVYVFAVPLDQRSRIALTVSYVAAAPIVLLTGSAPAR